MTFVYEKLLKEIELKFVHGQFIYNKFEFIDVFKNKFLPIKHLLNLLLDLIITIIYYFELRAQYIIVNPLITCRDVCKGRDAVWSRVNTSVYAHLKV